MEYSASQMYSKQGIISVNIANIYWFNETYHKSENSHHHFISDSCSLYFKNMIKMFNIKCTDFYLTPNLFLGYSRLDQIFRSEFMGY